MIDSLSDPSNAKGLAGNLPKRRSGCSPPYSIYFVLGILGFVVTTTAQFVIVICMVQIDIRWVLIIVSAVTAALAVIFWLYAVSSDPEATGPDRRYKCFGQLIMRETRFCSECRKVVDGMDHHCSFLNNCIGHRNYTIFYLLVTTLSLLMVEYVATSVIFQMDEANLHALERMLTKEQVVVWALVELHLLMSVLQGCMLIALWAFHTYLICYRRAGTYDWLMQRRKSMQGVKYTSNMLNNDDSSSFISHMSDKARQKDREEFERMLFTGKKTIHDSFRSNVSVNSPPPMDSYVESGSSYQWGFDDSDDIEQGKRDSCKSNKSRKFTADLIEDSNKESDRIQYNVPMCAEEGETVRLTNIKGGASTPRPLNLHTVSEDSKESMLSNDGVLRCLSVSREDEDHTAPSSGSDGEAVHAKKRLRKTDLLKKANSKVVPIAEEMDPLGSAKSLGPIVQRRGGANRGSVTTVNGHYDPPSPNSSSAQESEKSAVQFINFVHTNPQLG